MQRASSGWRSTSSTGAAAPPELQQKVGDWYAENFIPEMTRVLGREPALSDYLPVGGAPYYLQFHYIVTNPNPGERRKLSTMPATAANTAGCTPSIIP